MLLSLGGHSYEIVKTHLHHFLTAAAINLLRLDDFLIGGETEKTRISRFAALAPKEAA